MEKELWTLANTIAGFSVLQSLTVSIALGNSSLRGVVKEFSNCSLLLIIFVAIAYGGLYCFAVHRCRVLAREGGTVNEKVWAETTFGRIGAIYSAIGIFVFGLVASAHGG